MPVISTSVRGGIVAMLATRNTVHAAAETAANTTSRTVETEILLTRSGYIVVAG